MADERTVEDPVVDARPDVRSGPQSIPVPDRARLGEGAPWVHLPAAARRGLSLEQVRSVLSSPTGPGTRSGTPLSDPDPASTELLAAIGTAGPARAAAVLVPLFEEDGETRVVLTVRSGRLRSHRGEVAFPGGRVDPGESLEQAALREAWEEIGLDPEVVTPIGTLEATPTLSSTSVMTPVVAVLSGRPDMVANPDEVSRIFDVALADLLADGVFAEEWWEFDGRMTADGVPRGEFPVWFFAAGGEIIWGATARTLIELLSRVAGLEPPDSLRLVRR